MNRQSRALRTGAALLTIAALLTGLAACGSSTDLSCDEQQSYELAQEAPPVRAPDDLDQLDEFKQLPLPQASPRPPRAEGSPCLDLPPSILNDEGD